MDIFNVQSWLIRVNVIVLAFYKSKVLFLFKVIVLLAYWSWDKPDPVVGGVGVKALISPSDSINFFDAIIVSQSLCQLSNNYIKPRTEAATGDNCSFN